MHLPECAYHELHAGSPRVLIYDDADLQHRGIIVSEADSLPAGEDNPAANAIRNLLQDGNLNYKVVEKDDDGQFAVRHINRPGPSVLITTATRSLGDQLMTRLFTVEIEERPSQIRGALNRIADLELGPIPSPDPALIAYQEYLQALAPIDVVVPFARQITDYIGRQPNATRILRDSARILSLVKAVTVLRHYRRARDDVRRYIATVDDYEVVYYLLKDVYTTTVTGIDKEIREIVALIVSTKQADPDRRINTADIFARIDLSPTKVRRRLSRAKEGGWLVNRKDSAGDRFGEDD